MKGSCAASHEVRSSEDVCGHLATLTVRIDEQQKSTSLLKSKAVCSLLARANRFDKMVQISERQRTIGPQPTTLKNTLAAIVAAVWFDCHNYDQVAQVMASLG